MGRKPKRRRRQQLRGLLETFLRCDADAFDRMLARMADGLEAFNERGILLVQVGRRVRVCEYGAINGNVGVVTGEKTIGQIKQLFRHLPADHKIGCVQIIAGSGSDCSALLEFIAGCARRLHFTATVMPSPKPQPMIFSEFFTIIDRRVKMHGGVATRWTS